MTYPAVVDGELRWVQGANEEAEALGEVIKRLQAWGEYWHGCADAFYYERDIDAPPLNPGDLNAPPDPATP